MLVGIVSTPDTLILNACGVGSAAGIFYFKLSPFAQMRNCVARRVTLGSF